MTWNRDISPALSFAMHKHDPIAKFTLACESVREDEFSPSLSLYLSSIVYNEPLQDSKLARQFEQSYALLLTSSS